VTATDRVRAFGERHGEKLRFLVVGAWNTIFSLFVLWLLELFIPYDVTSVVQKQGILLASWLISITQNFFTFKLLVFKTRGDWWREYARMYVTYGAMFLVQSVMVQGISAYFETTLFWANIPTLVVVTILSYLGHKRFTFGENRLP
jgi:putative flippase GtrA